MERRSATTVATFLGLVAALFFLAMAFDILPRNYALFAGVAFGMIADWMWAFGRRRE
jgi:hypothetical protein